MTQHKQDENGNYICPVCNGTAYDDKVMQRYTNYVSKEDLIKYGVHFCSKCGVDGWIDWIEYARGVSRFEERKANVDIDALIDNITSFVAIYWFTEFKYKIYLLGLDGADRHEQREHLFDCINAEISPHNIDHIYSLDLDSFQTVEEIGDFNPDYIDGLNIGYNLYIYLNRSRDVTSATLVMNCISEYLDGRNVLPTKGLDAVINIFMELYPDEDEPIHPFLNDQIRFDLNYANGNADDFAIDIGLNSFDDIVKLVKDAEERTSYVATIEELQEKGVLFFD